MDDSLLGARSTLRAALTHFRLHFNGNDEPGSLPSRGAGQVLGYSRPRRAAGVAGKLPGLTRCIKDSL